MHPHWMLLCSLLNGTMLCSASSSIALTCRMQVKSRKGAIQGLTAKTRALKMVNRIRGVQMALLLVQTTSRSQNFLINISFTRDWAIKLLISRKKPACSICLDCLAQPKQNNNPFQFPLRETKEQKEVC